MSSPEAQVMSRSVEVFIVVEGPTEQTFIREVLAPEMARKSIYLHPALIGKPGHKGGNIRFDRARKDIEKFLKQRSDIYVSTMFDYYGINAGWPGRDEVMSSSPMDKATVMMCRTAREIDRLCPGIQAKNRFIPYFSMHEFEALLFSVPHVLADKLHVRKEDICQILDECGEPENINDNTQTAPSKRIENMRGSSFKKTIDGIAVARTIGIEAIRKKCQVFDAWLKKLEELPGNIPG